ncbi:hypothetical protein C0995_011770 [Termitomyces sp. Mi166|nr:hypothetical protein C0995_010915 [Termitomyces sp. Mi166\
MSMDIFKDVDNEHIERLSCYGTPPAIPQWDGWREMMEDNHYCLMFKRDEEHSLPALPEATGLYYYISMDPNRVHLWKCMAAHEQNRRHTSLQLTLQIGDVAMTLELKEVLEGNIFVIEGDIDKPQKVLFAK